MINLSTIHESKLTKFHRNHYIITVTDLKDTSIFKKHDPDCEKHFSLETCIRLFPNASKKTIASLLLTSMRVQVLDGQSNFLFVFNDENREVSFDIVNGLVHVLRLEASNEEQEKYFEYLRTFALEWTHYLIEEEARQPKMGEYLQ